MSDADDDSRAASDPRKRGLDLEDDSSASDDGRGPCGGEPSGDRGPPGAAGPARRRKRLAVGGGARSPADEAGLKRDGGVGGEAAAAGEEEDESRVEPAALAGLPAEPLGPGLPPLANTEGGAPGTAAAGDAGGNFGGEGGAGLSSTPTPSAVTALGGAAAAAPAPAAAAASSPAAPALHAIGTQDDQNPANVPFPLSVRCLVTTKDAGVIIGKGGKNVSEIRTRSQAKITISDMVPGAQERILTVAGPVDVVAQAFGLLAQKVVDETSTPESRIDSTSVRILAPHNVIGPLIGKGGGKIKEMQEASGACIMASEAVVPDSMEQTVTVSGAPEAIQSALYQIGRILQEQPSVPTVPYRPSASRPPALPAYPPIPPPAGLQQAPGHHQPQAQPVYADPYATVGPYGYPVQPSVPHAAGPFHHLGHPPAPGSVVHHPRAAAASPQAAAAAPAGTQAQQIFVPNEMVGCIIGKGGARINEIRQLSGCTIKIAEPNAWASERLVTITGTPEANQMALYLLYSRIELEKSRAPAGY